MPRVLVLGGGFGGLTVASELADLRLDHTEVTLVDQRPSYVMGLAKLWALDGRRPLEQGRKAYERLESRGVGFLRGVVRGIDLGAKAVDVDGRQVPYDYLVIALGADAAPEKLSGFDATMNLYAEAGVEHLRRALEVFEEGRIVVMVSSMPFKCPPAPYEAAFLVEAMLRRRGIRERAEIRLTTPEPYPLPVAPHVYGAKLAQLLADKRIAYSPDHRPTAIDAVKRLVHYDNGAMVNYDVLLGVPPHRPPHAVRDAGLTDSSGWIPVDSKTLATRHAGVWAIGDVAGVRLANGKLLPKAGTLAAGEGHVVAEQIAARILGRPSDAVFDGQGVCYIETGDGMAVPGRGFFYREPEPAFDLGSSSAAGLQEKEHFESLYMRRWFG